MSNAPYDESEHSYSKDLAYQFLDAYEVALNKSDFVERTTHLCSDTNLLEAIYDMIDLLTIGGK